MRANRRQFLRAGGLAALAAACKTTGTPPPKAPFADSFLDDLLERILSAAKKHGASYADVRVVRRRNERVSTREDHVVSIDASESYGVGLRVLVDGAWGFVANSNVDPKIADGLAIAATDVAKANSKGLDRKVELAKTSVHRDRWHTKTGRDPFAVPLAEKIDLLLSVWPEVKSIEGAKFCSAWTQALLEWKLFASSEGTLLEQSITRVHAGFEVTAAGGGEFETCRTELAPMQAGFEHIANAKLRDQGKRIAEAAVRKLKSPSVTPGKRDLILAPSNLWLVIHESVGHPTELDRALGDEANLAGTSFATVDKLGKLKYGAGIVTLFADKTIDGGLATCGYDDDGVKTQRWDLVKDGLFVGYQTTREQASWIGEKESRGTSYGEDWKSFPFQRMPNVSLAPDPKGGSLDDLVADTEDGILITGDGSWSIDHQRYNFQFGGQTFSEIKKGKIVGTLRDVAYQANSIDFWNSCDRIGGPKHFELHGALHDGKGEPMQLNAVSHGCPPARFRGVSVINTNAREKKA